MLILSLHGTMALAQAPVGEAWIEWPPTAELHGARPVEGRRVLPNGKTLQRVLLPPGSAAALRAGGVTLRQSRANHALGSPKAGYRTPAQGTEVLHRLASESSRAFVVTLGRSHQERPIDALVVGQDPETGAPVFRILAAHHGDEGASWEVALAVAEALVVDDGIDDRITRILDRATVWVVPYVNPDGARIGSRLNIDGVDLNRNYGFAWSTEESFGGPAPFSEPESRAIRAFGHHVQPVASLSLHAGATNFGWVWNHTRAAAPDAPLLRAMATAYADDCHTDAFWITQGADWYLTFGDTNDWSYGRYGVLDFTLELAEERTPEPTEIDGFVADHLDAVLGFLDQTPTVSGTVVDARTGDPVPAQITVEGGAVSAPFFADGDTGRFHRIVADPGLLHVQAPGYTPATLPLDGPEVFVALEPSARRVGRTEPWAVVEPGSVRLPEGAAGPQLTLARPGAEPVVLEVQGDEVELDPTSWAPGSWDLTDGAGTTFPGALWIDNPELVEVDAREWGHGELTVLGAGFAAGARVWAFADDRQVVVPVVEWSADRLVLDVTVVPDDAERIDVGMWVAGAHVGLAAVRTPQPLDPEGCGGCDSSPRTLIGPWMLVIVWLRRRLAKNA